MGESPSRISRREHILGLLFLAVVVAVGAAVRIEVTLESDRFDRESVEGLVLTDPGLLYYLTEQVEYGVPKDFRSDPRIEHPGAVDIPARFTVGQEFIVAAARRVAGDAIPLHVLCVWVMSILASLTVVGVYGLAFELSRSVRWACFAALFFTLLPANYRTLGFILVREDLSLPLFSMHLWLVARALRVQSAAACLMAGAVLGLSLATWHAAAFLAVLEAGAVFLWFMWSGRNAFSHPPSEHVLLGVAILCLTVPALWAKGAALGPAMCVAGGMWISRAVARERNTTAQVTFALFGAAIAFGLSIVLAKLVGTSGDFAHVAEVMWSKASHLGVLPENPDLLSFDARMMWQGPFSTLTPLGALNWFQFGLIALPVLLGVGMWRLMRGQSGDAESTLSLLLLLACFTAWLVERLVVLPGILVPVSLVLLLQRMTRASSGALAVFGVTAIVFLQGVGFGSWVVRNELTWLSPARRRAMPEMLAAVREHVPNGKAVAADFMSSTAVLAHTGRPIVLQPKWEMRDSRERVRAFWEAFYLGTPDDLNRLLIEDFDTEYLLVDRITLWWLRASRYLAGYGSNEREPRPDTAAAALLAGDDGASLPPVPGFELLWSGTPDFASPDGTQQDAYRLFRLRRKR